MLVSEFNDDYQPWDPNKSVKKSPKDPQDPPMEGSQKNLYDAGVFRSSK